MAKEADGIPKEKPSNPVENTKEPSENQNNSSKAKENQKFWVMSHEEKRTREILISEKWFDSGPHSTILKESRKSYDFENHSEPLPLLVQNRNSGDFNCFQAKEFNFKEKRNEAGLENPKELKKEKGNSPIPKNSSLFERHFPEFSREYEKVNQKPVLKSSVGSNANHSHSISVALVLSLAFKAFGSLLSLYFGTSLEEQEASWSIDGVSVLNEYLPCFSKMAWENSKFISNLSLPASQAPYMSSKAFRTAVRYSTEHLLGFIHDDYDYKKVSKRFF